MRAEPKPGEVYFVDLGMAEKPRNILIVAVPDERAPLAVVTGLSLTTKYHRTPYEVALPKLPWMREPSHVNAQSLSAYKAVELQRMSGKLEAPVMQQIQSAVRLWLGL
jgi:mRNA interferase MazF